MTSSTKKPNKSKAVSGQNPGVKPQSRLSLKSTITPSLSSASIEEVSAVAALHFAKALRSFEKAQAELQNMLTQEPDLERLFNKCHNNLEQILKAFEKLESSGLQVKTASTRNEVLEFAKKQAQEFKTNLVEKKLVASSGEICKALGLTRQSLSKAVKENRIFFLQHGHRRYYPVFYTDNRFSRNMLEDISQALGDLDGPQKWQFFTIRKGFLSGKTPLEALLDGSVDRVLIAASGFINR